MDGLDPSASPHGLSEGNTVWRRANGWSTSSAEWT